MRDLPWTGAIFLPDDWIWFPSMSSAERVCAQSPDGRSGFDFDVHPFSEESLQQFVRLNLRPCHRLPGQWDYSGIRNVVGGPVETETGHDFPMLSTSGTFLSCGETVDYAAAAGCPDAPYARIGEPESSSASGRLFTGACVMATSIDGHDAAKSLATTTVENWVKGLQSSPSSATRNVDWTKLGEMLASRRSSMVAASRAASERKMQATIEEHRRILDALAVSRGHQIRAAISLGMSRRSFVDRLRFYGVSWKDF